MAIINVGFDNNSPQAIDRAYGALSAGRTVAYASVAAANTAVISAYRHRGKTVLIDTGTGAYEYWWRVDTQDASLVPKVPGEQTWDFVVGDGGQYTPLNGTNVTLANPALVNAKILGFQVEGGGMPTFVRTGQIYATHDPATGIITLSNTNFATDSWYNVKYKQL